MYESLIDKVEHMVVLIRESTRSKDWEMLELRATHLQKMASELMFQEQSARYDAAKDQK